MRRLLYKSEQPDCNFTIAVETLVSPPVLFRLVEVLRAGEDMHDGPACAAGSGDPSRVADLVRGLPPAPVERRRHETIAIRIESGTAR